MFGNKIELKEYILIVYDGYNCEKCNRNYILKFGFKFYIVQEYEQKYFCFICGKLFGFSLSFNKYLVLYIEGFDIKCFYCRYIFLNKDIFMVYREFCRMLRVYICNQCGKGFLSKNLFQYYEVIYFDGKFSCYICGIKFLFSINLNRYIRIVYVVKVEGEDVKLFELLVDKESFD